MDDHRICGDCLRLGRWVDHTGGNIRFPCSLHRDPVTHDFRDCVEIRRIIGKDPETGQFKPCPGYLESRSVKKQTPCVCVDCLYHAESHYCKGHRDTTWSNPELCIEVRKRVGLEENGIDFKDCPDFTSLTNECNERFK